MGAMKEKWSQRFLSFTPWVLLLLVGAYRTFRHVRPDADWMVEGNPFDPSIGALLLYGLFVIACCLLVRFIPTSGSTRRIGLFFLLLAFFGQFATCAVQSPIWYDAQEYYDLAAYANERGMNRFLRDYQTLNTQWPEETLQSLEKTFGTFGLSDMLYEDLDYTAGEPNHLERAAKHPPLWPCILAFGMKIGGVNRTAALVTEWTLGALTCLVLFLIFYKKEAPISILPVLLVLLSPSFLMNSRAPLSDIPLMLFICLAVLFMKRGATRDSSVSYFAAGIAYGLAVLCKVTPLAIAPWLVLQPILSGRAQPKTVVTGRICLLGLGTLLPLLVLYLLWGYNYPLNVLTAIGVQGAYISTVELSLVKRLFITGNFLLYFGVAFWPLLIAGVIDNDEKRTGMNWNLWIGTMLFALLIFVLKGSELSRHLLPFMILIVPWLYRSLNLLEPKGKTVTAFIVLTSIQVLLYMW